VETVSCGFTIDDSTTASNLISFTFKEDIDDSDLLELDLTDINIPQKARPLAPVRKSLDEYPEVISVVTGSSHPLYCLDDDMSNDSSTACTTNAVNKISKLNLDSNSGNIVDVNTNNCSGSTDFDIEEIEEVMANFDSHNPNKNGSSPEIKPLGSNRIPKPVGKTTTGKNFDDIQEWTEKDFDESLYNNMPESDIPVGLDPTTVALNKLAREHEVINIISKSSSRYSRIPVNR